MTKPHSAQERRESGILAHWIELDGPRHQYQRPVAFLEGAVEQGEQTVEIPQTEMH